MSATIIANNITRRFGKQIVLDQFNLTCHPREFVAIVGRSGSGKSTLLRLLTGLDQPDSGTVMIDHCPLSSINPSVRVLFQDSRLLPWARVGDNVAISQPNLDRAGVTKYLQLVGLADRINDWPMILSGGQKQRVALARALAAEPKILLLDEPFGSLDALTRLDMQRLVEQLWQHSQLTAVLITHDIEEAVALADRVILLSQGKVSHEWVIPLDRLRDRRLAEFNLLIHQIRSEIMGSI